MDLVNVTWADQSVKISEARRGIAEPAVEPEPVAHEGASGNSHLFIPPGMVLGEVVAQQLRFIWKRRWTVVSQLARQVCQVDPANHQLHGRGHEAGPIG